MKTIGLLGGMSWESSQEYYRIMNEEVKKILGGTHSAKCIMYSFDFNEIEKLQHANKWDELTDRMVTEASNLKSAGADFIVICTNTMHLMAPDIEKTSRLKVLHIADVTGEQIKKSNIKKVALLGTKFTMESPFYKEILKDKYDVDVLVPTEANRQIVHDIIYNELILGTFSDESRNAYQQVIGELANSGAEGVILGCTEIPLLIKQEDVSIPIFDTTRIHAEAAVRHALGN